MRAERFEGTESKCRNQSVEENLRRFEEMKNGTEFVSINKSAKAIRESLFCLLR